MSVAGNKSPYGIAQASEIEPFFCQRMNPSCALNTRWYALLISESNLQTFSSFPYNFFHAGTSSLLSIFHITTVQRYFFLSRSFRLFLTYSGFLPRKIQPIRLSLESNSRLLNAAKLGIEQFYLSFYEYLIISVYISITIEIYFHVFFVTLSFSLLPLVYSHCFFPLEIFAINVIFLFL